eukprot:1753979-Rhodomonas_salina.2
MVPFSTIIVLTILCISHRETATPRRRQNGSQRSGCGKGRKGETVALPLHRVARCGTPGTKNSTEEPLKRVLPKLPLA